MVYHVYDIKYPACVIKAIIVPVTVLMIQLRRKNDRVTIISMCSIAFLLTGLVILLSDSTFSNPVTETEVESPDHPNMVTTSSTLISDPPVDQTDEYQLRQDSIKHQSDMNDSMSQPNGFLDTTTTEMVAILSVVQMTTQSSSDIIERESQVCPPHSIAACRTKCDPTCQNPLSLSIQCPPSSSCIKKDCVCINGFVFDDMSRKCVLPQSCGQYLNIHDTHKS